MSKTVAAAEFQAHSLELLEEVAARQEELVVVKDGKPLAKVVPLGNVPVRRSLEGLQGSVTILGDIVEPLAEWGTTK